jgi:hypothetical protein
LALHASRRGVTAQVANERVDLAALSFPFNCEQSHLRTAVGAGNGEILNIRSRVVVLLAHASDNRLCAGHERAIAWPGIGFGGGRATGTFRGNVGRPFQGSQVAGFGLRPRILTAGNTFGFRNPGGAVMLCAHAHSPARMAAAWRRWLTRMDESSRCVQWPPAGTTLEHTRLKEILLRNHRTTCCLHNHHTWYSSTPELLESV